MWEKIECLQCKQKNIKYWLYNTCELLPCDILDAFCAWCNEKIKINISETTGRWISTKQMQTQKNTVVCPFCGKQFESIFFVGMGHLTIEVLTKRIYSKDRKKNATVEMVEEFLKSNSIYKNYGIIHSNNAIEYCEQNHINEKKFFEVLEDLKVEIFTGCDMEDIDISMYEQEFSKLKLREDAMVESAGASLSRLLGGTKVWKNLRQKILQEKEYTCEICGYKVSQEKSKLLHVHEEWEQKGNIV